MEGNGSLDTKVTVFFNLFRNFAAKFYKKHIQTLMPDFKLLPMGISDFRHIRRENYYPELFISRYFLLGLSKLINSEGMKMLFLCKK